MGGTWRRAGSKGAALGLAGLLLSGCAATFQAQDALRVVVKRDGFVVVTGSADLARGVCIASAVAAVGAEGRRYADGRGATLADAGGGAPGCRMQVRSVIVCAAADERCILHEERHAREGAFHQ